MEKVRSLLQGRAYKENIRSLFLYTSVY